METNYFNFYPYIAERQWEYRRYFKKWHQLCFADIRYPPLHYGQKRILCKPQNSIHLARQNPQYIHIEALPQRKRAGAMGGALWEEVVAAAIIGVDPRREDRKGYLMLLQCANDEESLDRLLAIVQEEFAHYGVYEFVTPVGLSPHISCGSLDNFFHVPPPLHTPYNPPYMPELLASSLTPWQKYVLTKSPIPQVKASQEHALITASKATIDHQTRHSNDNFSLQILPLTARMARDDLLLPLWQELSPLRQHFPAPDQAEIEFIWRWLTVWPWQGWVAMVDGQPVGFAILQPDFAVPNRRAGGGQNPLWALWLQWREQRPTRSGRLLYGGVLEKWRNHDVARALYQQLIRYAQQQGWQTITMGPHPPGVPPLDGTRLSESGIVLNEQQHYTLFRSG